MTSSCTTEDGDVINAGEDYYVALENFDQDSHMEDGDEACEACGRCQLLGGMLECGQCLRGFHMRCLRPPLRRVPEGEWLCPQVRALR
jgi:origin recognition complex subunit 1